MEENEITKNIKIVTVTKNHQVLSPELKREFEFLDKVYPDIKMEHVFIEGQFGPELINFLSEKWKIPQNYMFISSPGDKFNYKVADLGGVRLIL